MFKLFFLLTIVISAICAPSVTHADWQNSLLPKKESKYLETYNITPLIFQDLAKHMLLANTGCKTISFVAAHPVNGPDIKNIFFVQCNHGKDNFAVLVGYNGGPGNVLNAFQFEQFFNNRSKQKWNWAELEKVKQDPSLINAQYYNNIPSKIIKTNSKYVDDQAIDSRNVLKKNVELSGVVRHYDGTPDSCDLPFYYLETTQDDGPILCFCGSSNYTLGCDTFDFFPKFHGQKVLVSGSLLYIDGFTSSYECLDVLDISKVNN